jgi:hypothetical protein
MEHALRNRRTQGVLSFKQTGRLAWSADLKIVPRPSRTDENYRRTGVNWPDSRSMSSLCRAMCRPGDVSPNRRHGQIRSVRGWRCRYDLQKGTFDVPPEFKEHNAKAVGPDSE